jgi:hypothetical protein
VRRYVSADLNKMAMEGVRKSVSPGMVRRQKYKKVPRAAGGGARMAGGAPLAAAGVDQA